MSFINSEALEEETNPGAKSDILRLEVVTFNSLKLGLVTGFPTNAKNVPLRGNPKKLSVEYYLSLYQCVICLGCVPIWWNIPGY